VISLAAALAARGEPPPPSIADVAALAGPRLAAAVASVV
jgi:hypothetical protein